MKVQTVRCSCRVLLLPAEATAVLFLALSLFRPPDGSSRWAYILLWFFINGILRLYISEMAGPIALKLSRMTGSVGKFGGKWFTGKISEPLGRSP